MKINNKSWIYWNINQSKINYHYIMSMDNNSKRKLSSILQSYKMHIQMSEKCVVKQVVFFKINSISGMRLLVDMLQNVILGWLFLLICYTFHSSIKLFYIVGFLRRSRICFVVFLSSLIHPLQIRLRTSYHPLVFGR